MAAGASLHLDALAVIGPVAVGLSAVRLVWIWAGTFVGRRIARLHDATSASAWKGLVSQAGVTLGLTTIVAAEFTEWGRDVQTLMVAMIAVHEVIGPMLFRSALANAGEIGRLDEAKVR